jgi:DNA-binding response OmpR family regulator
VRQAAPDLGVRPGPTTDERERLNALERENRELRLTNEILRKASAYLPRRSSTAGSSHDRLHRRAPRHPLVEPICRVLPIPASTYHAHTARRVDPGELPAQARRDAAFEIARLKPRALTGRPHQQRVRGNNPLMTGVLICVRDCNDEADTAWPGGTCMSDSVHILVVDDQRETSDVVREYLIGEGYRVSTAEDGIGMRQVLAQSQADLVILDLRLPGEDGLTLARSLRSEQPRIGIIILTGRSDPIDRIVGLEMGADDYLPKPFHLRELLARIKSVSRRVHARTGDQPSAARSRAHFAGWNFDLSSRELQSSSGTEVRLTAGEFDLLATFVRNANQVLSRDRLLDLTRNREAGPFDRTIDVLVGRLRRKLDDTPQNPTLIKTVRSGGYMFTPAVTLS